MRVRQSFITKATLGRGAGIFSDDGYIPYRAFRMKKLLPKKSSSIVEFLERKLTDEENGYKYGLTDESATALEHVWEGLNTDVGKEALKRFIKATNYFVMRSVGRKVVYAVPVVVLKGTADSHGERFIVEFAVGASSGGGTYTVNYLIPAVVVFVKDGKGNALRDVKIIANTPGVYDIRAKEIAGGLEAVRENATLYEIVSSIDVSNPLKVVSALSSNSVAQKIIMKNGIPMAGEYIHASKDKFSTGRVSLSMKFVGGKLAVLGSVAYKYGTKKGIDDLKVAPKKLAVGKVSSLTLSLPSVVNQKENYALNVSRPYVYNVNIEGRSVFSFTIHRDPALAFVLAKVLSSADNLEVHPPINEIEPCEKASKVARTLTEFEEMKKSVFITDGSNFDIPFCDGYKPAVISSVCCLGMFHFPTVLFVDKKELKPVVEIVTSVHVGNIPALGGMDVGVIRKWRRIVLV